MVAKVMTIKVDEIVKSDGSVIITPSSMETMADGNVKFTPQSERKTVGKEDLFVRITVDEEVDKINGQLIVLPTHVAMLVKDGILMRTLEEGKYKICDKKTDLGGLFNRKLTTDSIDIIYISKTARQVMPWGTKPPLELLDPVTQIPITVRMFGECEIRVGDPRKFYLEVVGMDKGFDMLQLRNRLMARLLAKFQPVFARMVDSKGLSYMNVVMHTDIIAEAMEPIFRQLLRDDYGLELCSFSIGAVNIPPEDKEKIEAAMKERRDEIKERQLKQEQKQDLREELAELERLADKKVEQQKYMAELEARNYERYLAVCKAIGWSKDPQFVVNQSIVRETPQAASAAVGVICTNCQNAIPVGSAFCNRCGTKAPSPDKNCVKCGSLIAAGDMFCGKCGTPSSGKKNCSCGREVDATSAFCPGCGSKL